MITLFKQLLLSKRSSLLSSSLVLIAIIGYAILLFQKGLNPGDDIEIVHMAQTQSFFEILMSTTETNTGIFYRPIIRLCAKPLVFLFGVWPPAFTGLVFIFTLSALWLYYQLFKKLNIQTLYINLGLLTALSSPFLWSGWTWLADLGSLIIVNLILITLTLFFCSPTKKNIIIGSLFIIPLALICKEHGLILPALFFGYFILNRHYVHSILPIVFVILYFILRYYLFGEFLPTNMFVRESGFFTEMLSVNMKQERFGTFPYFFYLYTIIAQFLDVFFTQPHYGQFGFDNFSVVKLFRFGLYSLTSLVLLIAVLSKKRPHPWFLFTSFSIIVINCILSYKYAEIKVILIAGMGYCLLIPPLFQHAHHTIQNSHSKVSQFPGIFIVLFFLVWSLNTGIFLKKIPLIMERDKLSYQDYLINNQFPIDKIYHSKYKSTYLKSREWYFK